MKYFKFIIVYSRLYILKTWNSLSLSGSGKAFNWLTQSSLDTFMEARTIGGDSQLLFNHDRGQSSSRSANKSQVWASGGQKTKKTMTLKTGAAGEGSPSTSRESPGGMFWSVFLLCMADSYFII